ncbi:hypothetical protein ANANG_G00127180 [Anguilla anguilla]|uniref:Uncharacterized protein n=1 Tax=Anguilla anguilla TaxID=7936 RepID=A0A9D3S262_ANGAN|nr:hypothetical protein ANANG_G00127180 [Anguilla anguilla]
MNGVTDERTGERADVDGGSAGRRGSGYAQPYRHTAVPPWSQPPASRSGPGACDITVAERRGSARGVGEDAADGVGEYGARRTSWGPLGTGRGLVPFLEECDRPAGASAGGRPCSEQAKVRSHGPRLLLKRADSPRRGADSVRLPRDAAGAGGGRRGPAALMR